MFPLHKGICTFNAISIKIPVAFTELEKKILKFTQNHKILLIIKAILRKNKAEDITIPDFKVYYKAIVVKHYGTGVKKDTYQWKRIKRPEINPCIHGQLIYDMGNKTTPWL